MSTADILRLAPRPWVWHKAFRLWRQVALLAEQHRHFTNLYLLARGRGNGKVERSLKRLLNDNWDELVTTKAHLQMCIKPNK